MTVTTAATAPTRRRRALAPLATLLAAVAIAAVSGATFNSSTANEGNTVTTGELDMLNDRTVIFANDNMKPGDSVTGDVTITNDGTLPATFTLSESGTSPFGTNARLTIVDTSDGAEIYAGPLAAAGDDIALGEWDADEARRFVFTVTLADGTPNTQQGLTATTAYTWDSIQTSGEQVTNQR
jgi:spore coat-associated protein N